MQGRLQLRFAGADPAALVHGALASGLLPATAPNAVLVDMKQAPAQQPLPELVRTAEDLSVDWGQQAHLHWSRRHDRLVLERAAWDIGAHEVLAMLKDWPFQVCTTGALDPTWWSEYRSIHGWAFILKEAGHRLVSPRVVDRGPWRLLRREDSNVTLFQFHDLEADLATALEQARPGHALLAPVWLGGHYASQASVFRASAGAYRPSLYDAEHRTSIVLVTDREVSAAEMGIAAGTRVHQIFPEVVDQVAFVFFDEATAQRQLPALWLYGLEVRAMKAEGEKRIDADYDAGPPPPAPAWLSAHPG